MKRSSRGFTIVEVTVVVIVIAILASLIALGFTQVQARSRDGERKASTQIIAEALERYYDKYGEYPACGAITSSATDVANNTLVGIDTGVLVAPQDKTASDSNSIQCADLTSTSDPDYFAYVGDGSSNCQTGNACLSYTIKYRLESENRIASITSRRNTNINTSGKPVLSAASITGFTSANLSWTGVTNSSSYTVQWATNSSFTTGLGSSEPLGVNTSLSTLSYNTLYYFRVRANSGANSVSDWSNTVSARTRSLAQPTCTVTANTLTQMTVSWGAISYAASYTLEYATNSSFTSATAVTGITGTSRAVSGLTGGTTVYFRVKAVNGAYSGSWCGTVSHAVMPSTAPTVTYNSVTTTTIGFSWTTVFGAARYESQWRANDGAWSAIINYGTGTSITHGPATPGDKIEIQVRAVNASNIAGDWSTIVGTNLSMPTPVWNSWGRTESYPSWSTWLYNAGGTALCPTGTSVYSSFRDGIYNTSWNGWSAFGSNGGSSETLRYTSTISNYTSTLQTQFQGYCRNNANGTQSSTITSGVSTTIHTEPVITLAGPVECAGAYSGRNMYQLRLWLDEVSYNYAANTSVVNWTLYRYSTSSTYHSYDYSKTWPWAVSINGSNWSGSSNSRAFETGGAGTTETIASSSLTVAHDGNGNATIGYAGSDGPGSGIFGSASCSGSYGLGDLRP